MFEQELTILARVHQIKKVPLWASSPLEPSVITLVLRVSSPLGAPFLFGAHGPPAEMDLY